MSGPSARMLALLSLLQARREWPGHVLAERLEVTTRTVRRDVDRLRALGYAIDSAKGPDGSPSRSVEPHGLVARNARWYLVAWDLDRHDWRTFRLDRMTPRNTAGLPFTPKPIPAGDPAAFVAARAKGSNSADRWPCVGTFEIDLPTRQLAIWIHDGQIEEPSPNRSMVTTGSWSWAGLLADIVRFGAPFRIVAPTELILESQRLAQHLDAATATDTEGGSSPSKQI